MSRPRWLQDERGMALPLALITLVLLTSLTVAFVSLSATEPLIVANLRGGDQALAVAEAAVERARWALGNPAAPASGLTNPLPDPVPSPYANQLVAFAGGAYQVAVTAGPGTKERTIVAIGSILKEGASLPGAPPIPQADLAGQRVVQVVVSAGGTGLFDGVSPPGALTVGGSVQMSGNSTITGSTSTCGDKSGVTITDISAASGQTNSISTSGNASITGTPATSSITNTQFQQNGLSFADLASLKALAQQYGTYVQPTSSSHSLTLTNGLTFVDTINGQALSDPFDPGTDTSKLATVSIAGNNTGSGWLIVMGSLHLSGNTSYTGLIYALNDLQASGNTHVIGAIVSQNAVDTIATVIDTASTGNSSVTYSCSAISNGGGSLTSLISTVPPTYAIKPGTWKSCPVGSC